MPFIDKGLKVIKQYNFQNPVPLLLKMSVPSGPEAKILAKNVELEYKKALGEKIDADVQMLKERAAELIRTVPPDGKGYYRFKLHYKEIKYDDKQIVIDRFCQYMEDMKYVVPTIPFQKSWWHQNGFYIISFRPVDEDEEETSDISDESLMARYENIRK